MSFLNPHLILVNGDRIAADSLTAAAGLAFAQWQFSSVSTVDEAMHQTPSEAELLVLVDVTPEERKRAREITLPDGLPRWAVLHLSEGAGTAQSLDVIPQAEWHPAPLARHLRHALTELELRRKCLRHEGDLHTMARRIRHDLNAPLNGILSMTELIQDMTAGSGHGVEKLTPSVFEAIEGMVVLIDRVSFLAKASSVPEARVRVPMEEPLWGALQKLESKILKQHAHVDSTNDMPEVTGVASWLQMIWQILISNALKHGGEAPRVRIGWSDISDGLKFWVEDHGKGVSEGLREGLFKPFHLLHRDNRAHGLGLSLAQRLVALQGGHCGYEMVEHGTRFFFVLPKDPLTPSLPAVQASTPLDSWKLEN